MTRPALTTAERQAAFRARRAALIANMTESFRAILSARTITEARDIARRQLAAAPDRNVPK